MTTLKYSLVLSVLLAFLSTACSVFPVAPKSPAEGLYGASAYIDAAVQQVNDAYKLGVIDKPTQLEALDALEEANAAVRIGVEAFAAGRVAQAEGSLAIAEAALRRISHILNYIEGGEG